MTMFLFSGPENEADLKLCRSGIFTRSCKLGTMTICPLHGAKLGPGSGQEGQVQDAEFHLQSPIMGERKETGQKGKDRPKKVNQK